MPRDSAGHSAPCAPTLPAVRAEGLGFAYENGRTVLEDINLTVTQGDFLALIGPNGGGKTTLLRLLLGMLEPLCGSVEIFGAAPARAGSRAGSRVGYVPQFSTLDRNFPASVMDMALMGAASPGPRGASWSTGAGSREKAAAYLELLGLGNCLDHCISDLSGGQKQRALVARALMSFPVSFVPEAHSGEQGESAPIPGQEPCAPYLLLLDEPTASIDPEGTFCFFEFLGKLRGRVTVIVVSHDLFIVSPFFSHIAFVNKTLSMLSHNQISPESLTLLFGRHLHHCPVGDLQHAGMLQQHDGCSHPACEGGAARPETAAGRG